MEGVAWPTLGARGGTGVALGAKSRLHYTFFITTLIIWNKTRASTIWAPTFIIGIFINNASGALRDAAFFAYADNYLIHVKFGIIMDVEASRAIRRAEVEAPQQTLTDCAVEEQRK